MGYSAPVLFRFGVFFQVGLDLDCFWREAVGPDQLNFVPQLHSTGFTSMNSLLGLRFSLENLVCN